jgi:hypothetical protein
MADDPEDADERCVPEDDLGRDSHIPLEGDESTQPFMCEVPTFRERMLFPGHKHGEHRQDHGDSG